jgi:small GTP-binding protein
MRGQAVVEFCAQRVRTRRPLNEPGRAFPLVLRAKLLDEDGEPIDDILVTQHAGSPAVDVRLHLHGSPWVVRRTLELLRAAGFVERGDQTAPLWPAPDAITAEAWELLPRMTTLAAARWLVWQARELPQELGRLLDASPDEARRRCREIAAGQRLFERLAHPIRVCIAGPPNAGKSTLANALAGQSVSLVSPVAGTTRDWVEAPGEAQGFPVVWIDTAGLRVAGDELETEGIGRTRRLLAESDQAIVVLDGADRAYEPLTRFAREYGDLRPSCVVLNKCDLAGAATGLPLGLPEHWQTVAVSASALRGDGLREIAARVAAGSGFDTSLLAQPTPAAFTARQVHELLAASGANDRNIMRDRMLRCIGGNRRA